MPLINFALISRDSDILADALAFTDDHYNLFLPNVKGFTNIGMKSKPTPSFLKSIKLKFIKEMKYDNDDDDDDDHDHDGEGDGDGTTQSEHVYIKLAKQVLRVLDTSRNLQFFCAQNIHEK